MSLILDLFLMILGVVKVTIVALPSMIFLGTVNFVISVILLPYDIVLTYRCLFRTNKYGTNLKILAFLLLPFCLFAWPFLVVIAYTAYGLFLGLKVYSYTIDLK